MSLQCLTIRSTAFHQSSVSIKKFSRGIFAVAMSFGVALTPACAHQGKKMNQSPTALMQAYGTLADQTPINQVTLTNSNGISVDVINYGGIITRIETPDSNGKMANIVLGMDNLEAYVNGTTYFGAIIGRYGNRIANGKFSLNGTDYQLATNDGENHLHGGVQGFDKKVWTMTPFSTKNSAGVTLKLISPDGDQGYPGTLTTEVIYTLTNKNTFDMQFVAKTDKPTIINMTQHSYFNLAGQGDILSHQMQINSNAITPVDGGLIPSGDLMQVSGTPFDFTQPKQIGKDINVDNEQLQRGKGYDHNFVLKNEPNHELIEAASVYEPNSGRTLTVYTEEPAVQFYSGNFLDGSTRQASGLVHKMRSGFCLEPQHFPDSPNQPTFPSTTLMPGEVYSTRIVYEFGTK